MNQPKNQTLSEKEAVTLVLDVIGENAPGSSEELLPLVYQELRKLAQGRLNHERRFQISSE